MTVKAGSEEKKGYVTEDLKKVICSLLEKLLRRKGKCTRKSDGPLKVEAGLEIGLQWCHWTIWLWTATLWCSDHTGVDKEKVNSWGR